MKKLFLLDAYALIYRAHFAFIKNPRLNSQGLDTSAIYGFINTLEDILNREKPSHIAVVFDPPTPTFRHEMYSEYKAQRPPTPEGIKAGTPYIKQIIEAYNIPIYQVDTFEADDLIATMAVMAAKQDFMVYMMTPDKDYCQVVSENIFMYKPGRRGSEAEVMGIEEVNQKFQIESPSQVIEILGLMGDASDNIPGAPGVGEKTAQKLISKYGSIENLLANTKDLKGKQKEKIEGAIDQILLSKKLVTIDTEVPFDFSEDALQLKSPNIQKLKEIFEKLEFRTVATRVLNRINREKGTNLQGTLFDMAEIPTVENEPEKTLFKDITSEEHEYILVDTPDKRQELLKLLSAQTEFCFDTETTGIDAIKADIVGISFSYEKHKAWYIHLPKEYEEAKAILKEFESVFENENIQKIGQNIKYDLLILRKYEIKVKGKIFDTMIAHYLLNPDQRHNMDLLAEVYLKYKTVSITELIGKKGNRQLSMRQIDPERICEYAGEDADITYQLKTVFEKMLAEENLLDLFDSIEMPLIPVLTEMELSGVKADENALKVFSAELREKIGTLRNEILEESETDFNLDSPKQLGEVLFEKMKIAPKPKMTKTKQYSTNETELQKYVNTHPIVKKILDYRGLVKLLNTYVESLPALINTTTERIHTSYNQAVAATGRLSSANPNLQNIPIRTTNGKKIRAAFIPGDDSRIILAADYSQIELRLMAHLSEDENMIAAFKNKEDIHTATAAKINNIPIEEVDKDMRSKAKSANFGIIYGISSFGLAQNLNISRTEAKQLIDGYFNSYPGVKKYMTEVVEHARKNEYVKTIFNRKRHLSDINSRNGMVRGIAERNAINAPIQGSAADLIKLAMIKIQKRIENEGLQSKMIIQVHDELVFDALKDEKEKLETILSEEMINLIDLKVPLTIDIGTGNNWLEAH